MVGASSAGVVMTLARECQDGVGGELVGALEVCWAAIRARHPEVPPAVLVTGAGTPGPRGGVRLGHFAASRWRTDGEATLGEVFVGGEGLARGARDVVATLLHEAAHALADRRRIQDTSRQGRYHNRRFKRLAEELGLRVEHHPALGWSPTTLPDATSEWYAPVIAALAEALTVHRAAEPTQRRRRPSSVACVCSCGRRIRIAPSVLEHGPVICGVCSGPFELVGGGGDSLVLVAIAVMWLQPITYRGRVVACVTASRVFLVHELEGRPADDPELRFVLFICANARDVIVGEVPGPYSDEQARVYARAALIPDELIDRSLGDVRRTARALRVPVDELQHVRHDHCSHQVARR